jgi:lipopolysaccharide export system protein LptA
MPPCFARPGKIDAAALGLTLLLCGMPLSRPSAQAVAPGGNEPIQIQADSGIEWQQDAHLYIARGNAVASRGPSEVHADTLIAHYRKAKRGNAGSNTEIYRVEAKGHVMLKRGSQTVVGDRAVEDVDRAITVVTGKALKLTTASDVVTARDSLEWYDQKQIAVARGDAVATRNGKTIRADVLTAYLAKSPAPQAKAGVPGAQPGPTRGKHAVTPAAAPGSTTGGAAAMGSKISRVDAQGHVVIKDALDTGRGDYGVYNADTGIATLIGNVVIERGKDVIRGQHGVMDLNRNISRMMPGHGPGTAHQRVQGLFVRRDQDARGEASTAAPGRNSAPVGNKRP